MAKGKKKTFDPTSLGDCADATLGPVNSMKMGNQFIQFISVTTETKYPCSVCGRLMTSFWTMNKPFVSSEGGNLMPAFSLVCDRHGPAVQETADDYVQPEPEVEEDYKYIPAGEWDIDEKGNIVVGDETPIASWPCMCNMVNSIENSICSNCEAFRDDQPAWTCGCGVHNHHVLEACKGCGKEKPDVGSTENDETVPGDGGQNDATG